MYFSNFVFRNAYINNLIETVFVMWEQKRHVSIKMGPVKRTRVIFYVRRIGLYLYKYKIYGTISIYILKDLASIYQLIYILHH